MKNLKWKWRADSVRCMDHFGWKLKRDLLQLQRASVISFMIKHFEMIGFYFASAFFIPLRARVNGNDSLTEHNVIVGNILMFCCDKVKSTATLALIEIRQICVFPSNSTPICTFAELEFYSTPNDGCKPNWSACCSVRKIVCVFKITD